MTRPAPFTVTLRAGQSDPQMTQMTQIGTC
jgi:hypothetical protein